MALIESVHSSSIAAEGSNETFYLLPSFLLSEWVDFFNLTGLLRNKTNF